MEFWEKIRILGKFLDDNVKKNTVVMFMASLGYATWNVKLY